MIFDMKDGSLIVDFDTYTENDFSQENRVAFEPTERDSFSSDSRQAAPFTVILTATRAISADDDDDLVNVVESKLRNLLNSTTLVRIILQPMSNNSTPGTSQFFQYNKSYINMIMKKLEYKNTPEQLELVAVMTFQEFRMTDTEYTSSLVTANPENSSTSNAGQVQPNAVSDTSLLKSGLDSVLSFLGLK